MTLTGSTDEALDKKAAALGVAVGLYGLTIPKGFGDLDRPLQRQAVEKLASEFEETLRAFGYEIVPVATGGTN